jgi:hypothetical protein
MGDAARSAYDEARHQIELIRQAAGCYQQTVDQTRKIIAESRVLLAAQKAPR